MANRNFALTPPETPSASLSESTPLSHTLSETAPSSHSLSGTTPSSQSLSETTLSEQKKAATAADLVRLAAIIDKVVNTNDFDFTSPEAQELLPHIAWDFNCQIDCIRHPDERLSWKELVAAWRKGAEDDPGVKLAWTSVTSTIDEAKGFAQVYLEKEITAVGGLKFHVMEEQRWRRDFGKWLLTNMLGMRGTPANSGFDSGDMSTTVPGMVEQVSSRPLLEEALEKTSSQTRES